MANTNDLLKAILALRQSKVVSCPKYPMIIKESDTGTTLEDGDTLGLVFELAVPKSGIIYSATFFDFDAEGEGVDLEIFKTRIVDVATDENFAPTIAEGLTHLTELSFVSFDDHGLYQTSELTNIGKAYSVPGGIFYIQAVVRAGYTVAAGSPARIQLQILSDDPDWQEE